MTPEIDFELPPLIDHALLDPLATTEDVKRVCEEADRYHFATVCVYPVHVQQAAELLHGKKTQVCAVVGFPSGASVSAVKLQEAQLAAEAGATELDVVINLGWLRSGRGDAVHRELAEICEETGLLVKAILEMGRLTPPEKQLAAEVCLDAGVAFLKTGTGWAGGATVADVELLHTLTRGQVGIKAAGGIHTLAQVAALVHGGATRLGTSRGVALMQELKQPTARSQN
ncbi:deoxyribose-phosphate aldolase [Prochlorothrix hollandica]|uniref:Deoxyribose-phosphate aldolase n=1 Tax=Prochlorothrix hollandica PCC 9006 = CALU 1027 TaxID=317619 RepID=A0A0M2PX18_PROHO|nr:deoxyribose-phosphate aldolase [Prochlorothrix hollandica]KKI99637.1 deoxyribose-phosphate aldolase [Prochlorothrix hollandica PCC 9006 = CALU 1027]